MPVTLKCLKPNGIPVDPQTLGEHVKARRLALTLYQRDVALLLKVSPETVLHWEKGNTEPPVASMPALLKFLGYDPFPEPKALSERLFVKRRAMGWSIQEAARNFGVDPGTCNRLTNRILPC